MSDVTNNSQRNVNIKLLTTLVDLNDEKDGEYRFLVDNRNVKYVSVAPGSLPKDDRTFAPILIPLLPEFPPGNWNVGHVSKNDLTEQLEFTKTTFSQLPGVENTWHPVKIDHLELQKLDRIRQNIHKVSHPEFEHPVVAKFTEFPWQTPYLEAETTAYQWIDGTGVGPKFFGHVTESGRTIGFLMEFIEGAHTATLNDVDACQAALAKLHALGIKHGDINKYNFLVREEDAVIIDFESAMWCEDKKELEDESGRLEESLRSDSTRGGIEEAFVA
jgi:predicted Ser/Thr protein kinase